MKILLLYPKFPATFWSFAHALKFVHKKAAFPPLGLLTVASLLPPDWPARLIDLNVEPLADEDLRWADLVFIGAMAVQRGSALELLDRCRAAGVKTVVGGPLFTGEPEEFAAADHLVLDEAELTLPRFLDDLRHGRPQRIYRAEGFCDLAQTPPPAWSLIDCNNYASLSVQVSRGCPFDCDFCNVTVLFGRRPRLKSARQLTAELDLIYAAGWRGNIFFVDDNFIGNKQYVKAELLPALIAWRKGKKGCVFFTEASINLADDPELMELMARAGFDSVFIGIESPDEASLAECQKQQNKGRDLLRSVRAIQRRGLQVMGGFIVGFDVDGPGIFQRQIDFIQRSGIVTAMVGMLQAPPGTRLFERLRRENRVAGPLLGDNCDGSTNILPAMGLERLRQGYRTMMCHIYEPRHYYRRVQTLLRNYRAPQIQLPANFQRFLVLVRSGWWLGVCGRERFQYWHLLLWTLLRRPRLMPLAVTLAIYGHHFRRICDSQLS